MYVYTTSWDLSCTYTIVTGTRVKFFTFLSASGTGSSTLVRVKVNLCHCFEWNWNELHSKIKLYQSLTPKTQFDLSFYVHDKLLLFLFMWRHNNSVWQHYLVVCNTIWSCNNGTSCCSHRVLYGDRKMLCFHNNVILWHHNPVSWQKQNLYVLQGHHPD